VELFGYTISSRGLAGDVERAAELMHKRAPQSRVVACANPHSLVVAREDPEFREALHASDLLLPDGAGIVLAARVLGLALPERVAGMEFFLDFSRRAAATGARYFFLGSTPEVLDRIVVKVRSDFPGIVVAGTYSPPFRDVFTEADNEQMIAAVRGAQPDVLWVGMTAPKQEKWIERHRARLGVPLIGAIGAVFDFYAETKKRSPEWARKSGLEWLPRLLREPRRLWRRNFVSTPLFLGWLVRERLARRS
jgi:N-acetylglucosaminyldiphosphoundecaprenol N-acetyl-beta-D-mannosaminyltransferase